MPRGRNEVPRVGFPTFAEELRAILPEMKDPLYRKILEKIILDYDKLAVAQEKLAKS